MTKQIETIENKTDIMDKFILVLLDDISRRIKECAKEDNSIGDLCYHHNSRYIHASKIMKYGLLSIRQQAKLENRDLTKEELSLHYDEMHVGGIDHVSLSKIDKNYDANPNEFLYDPYIHNELDIIIKNDIKARRSSFNYSNEYLVQDKILRESFSSIDLRILRNFIKFENNRNIENLRRVIYHYNSLINVANEIVSSDIEIPLREMSFNPVTLDKEKIIKLPIIDYLHK